jgi:hypothetical protein
MKMQRSGSPWKKSFFYLLSFILYLLIFPLFPDIASAAQSRPVIIDPTELDFGDTPLCQQSTQKIIIANNANGRMGNINIGSLASPFNVDSFGPCYDNQGQLIQGCTNPNPVLLPPGKKLLIQVSFSPTSTGSFSDTLVINQTSAQRGNQSITKNLPVRGRGIVPTINVDISPDPVDFGNAMVGGFVTQRVLITNRADSTGQLEGTASISPGPPSPFFVVGGGSFSLSPGKSQVITLRFAPTSIGSASANLVITYKQVLCDPNSPTRTTTVGLTGTGVPLISMAVNPSSLSFGDVPTGQFATQAVRITNLSSSTGTLTVNIGALPPPFSIIGGNSADLAPGDSMVVAVRFSPLTPGPFSGTLNITHNASRVVGSTTQSSPFQVPLSGTGVLPTIGIVVSPNPVDFGSVPVGKSSVQVITIENPFSSTAPLDGTVGNLSSPFSVTKSENPFSLAPGKSIKVAVSFSPTDVGPFSTTLVITHNAPNGAPGGVTNIPITGVGGPAVNLLVSPSPVNFGNVAVGQSTKQIITLANLPSSTGTLEGTISSISGPFSIVSGGTGTLDLGSSFSLAPGKSTKVVVSFTPTSPGTASGTLVMTHNATNKTSPTQVILNGTGIAAANLAVKPLSIDFGNVPVGQSVRQTLTIINLSDSTATLEGVVNGLSSPFSVVSGLGPFSLDPGKSQSVVILFSPTSSGTFSDTLTITHNAANVGSPVNILIRGTAVESINLSVSPISVSFGSVLIGEQATQTLAITNLSSSTGTLQMSIGNLSSPFSLVSGGGSFNLAPGASRTLTLGFSPTSPGAVFQTLTLTHNATNQTSPMNISVNGVGVSSLINMEISPDPIDFGDVPAGQSATQTLTITNLSSSTGDLVGSFGNLSGPFSIISGGNPFTLAPGKSQSVILRFSPTSPGVFSQALSLTHNATNLSSPANVLLNGKGISGVNLLINTTPLDLGNVIVGQSVNQVLTIANLSTSANTLTGSVGNLSNPFSVVSGGGPFSLAPGESQSVIISFSPTSPGTFSQTLAITHNATNQINPLSIPVSGTGTTASINIDINPSSLNFGNIFVGKSATQTFTITNLSNSTDVLEGNINNLSGPFSVVTGGGTFTLAPGKSQSVTISFSPGSEGTFSETLFITHNATNQGSPAKVSLNGTGQALIQLSVVPSSIDFGNILVGQSSTQTLTIKNEATSTGTLEGTVGTLSGPFSIMKGGGPFSLAPGKSLSVVLNFSPTSAGTFSQLLTITHNATGQTSPADISITGTGVLPVVNMLISQTSIDFGNVSVGKTATRSFTITNLATSTDTLTGSVGNLLSPFSVVSGDGAFSLAPGESQFVVIAFSPELSGPASETLVITHNATNQTGPTNLTLTGTGTAVINLSINPTSISFGNMAVGQTDNQVFMVTNEASSTDTLEVNAGSLSAPFSIVSGGGIFSLAPGKSRPILVSFSPTSPGTFSQTLSIAHNATNVSSPVNVAIQGTGVFVVNLSVNFTPSTGSGQPSINFGEVEIGQSATQMITLTNQASSTNTLTGTVGTLSNPFSVVSGSGSFSLAPGKSQTLLVRFSPTSAGTFSQTLVITHNATNSGSPFQISISGIGKATVNLFISSTSLSFGNILVGETSTQTITLTNEISSTGLLTGNFSSPPGPFFIAQGGGPFSLAPGQSQTIQVIFSPTFPGLFLGTFSITHNGGNQPTPLNILLSGATPISWGARRDIPVPRDYDGDQKTDIAVWRPGLGNWYILSSRDPSSIPGLSGFVPAWGMPGDRPVPADYDGDGKADLAVFRPSTQTWLIQGSLGGIVTENFGAAGDIPIPGDYDGDGKADLAIFRPSTGEWDIKPSGSTSVIQVLWGLRGDLPTPGDYDGDGKTDIAVWRPGDGTWNIIFSSGGSTAISWGLSGDRPVPGDYDGDGKTDIAVWRPGDGTWNIIFSGGGSTTILWGLSGDIPVPADYNGDGKVDIAVWRPDEGVWYILL